MEKENPLLPFAFNSSSFNDNLPLDTTPRKRAVRDENVSLAYRTRKSEASRTLNRPTLAFAPSLKRKMGESFNEKDDIKRRETEFDSEPTVLEDSEEDDYKENISYKSILPPSSPPLDHPLVSEFDFNTNTNSRYDLPESPENKHDYNDFPSESQSYSPVKAKQFSSEADFGIDSFNRFKNISNRCPSSTGDRAFEESQVSYVKARDIILASFEDVKTVIDLEGMSLYELPDEIKDMNNLVIFQSDLEPISYQLYLSNNKLRCLPPSLFKFTKLNVLGLRQNKISSLPACINKLVHLTDLNIGSNRLQFLPSQILELPSLQTFRAGPNPFLKVPEDAIPVENIEGNSLRQKKFVSKPRILASNRSLVPSLKTICLNRIAQYDVSYQETKKWKKFTPKLYHSMIIRAIKKGHYHQSCSECSNIVVEAYAEVFEWWDILQNKNVPVRRQLCSGGCLERYQAHNINEIDEIA
ncbi:conserved hypothetical protein [Scheffersomyces stipitis CBS 6054]|uniref:Uncharacterized protein n=1 Tax=Scheffersomyces stipitis (strain ATCC 58785 / CBS 6054 / NBRC 10063 / NRRL Y-11545) TaxID=322104 RepID=A3LPN9_PICST|nr:conserved hypothetical protein [Scheffersomyces stipitis CBS 6054]ABN64530.1 conserved hypothetical protein [Scheffersomyces stipitis CBS 6054]